MVNKKLLREGRPGRPSTGIVVWGIVSFLIIALSTTLYFLVRFVPDMTALANEYRVVFTIMEVRFDYVGVDFIKMVICIPLSVLGALLGSINLIRMTNRKPFLSALHIIPALGFISLLLGFISYYFLAFLFKNLPFQLDPKIFYLTYVISALVYVAGIAFADIFAFFYNQMHYAEFVPIYQAYHRVLNATKKNSERSLIRYNFRRYWKQYRYEELLTLLMGDNIKVDSAEDLEPDSYAFLKEKALKNVEDEKVRELDALYESGQHALLLKELASMSSNKSDPKPYILEEEPEKKKAKKAEPAPKTIIVDDGEEVLTRYGRHQIQKGRKKAMRMARKRHAY